MSLITHVFESHKKIRNGVVISHDFVQRRANFVYDPSGSVVDITIIPVLSTKRAYLTRQDGYTLYYIGEDTDYRFEMECWPDNGTIKRFSVFRDDTGIEYRYLSNHQDRMW
ncbi:MAG: hypothetical protein J6O23_09040 [Prevotella sp.]|nr:hypothetical protein [Prevotella sp.]